jgi:hypothetical protein
MADDTDLIDPDEDDIEAAVADLDTETETSGAADNAALAVSVDADVDAVLDEADGVAAPSDGPARGPDGKFIPKAEAAPAPEAAATEPPVVPETAPVDPFAALAPFPFKVDGTDVNLDGIRADDRYIHIPRELWDRELRPNYLGSRQAWQQERAQWQQQQRGFQQQVTASQQRADAIVNEFNALISDREKLIGFVENFEREGPLLMERMRADAAVRQLQQYNEQIAEQQRAREYEDTLNRGADAFEQAAVELFKDPAFAVLAPANDDERDDLLAEIWRAGGPAMVRIFEDRSIAVDRDALMQDFQRRAQFIQRREAKWREASTTEQRNKAAVSPPATSPQTAPIPGKQAVRKPLAAAKAPTRAAEPVPAHRITDEMREQWKNDFASVFDD